MQLVFISQYPPQEEVTFTPATSPPTVVGRDGFSQPCQEVCASAPPTYG